MIFLISRHNNRVETHTIQRPKNMFVRREHEGNQECTTTNDIQPSSLPNKSNGTNRGQTIHLFAANKFKHKPFSKDVTHRCPAKQTDRTRSTPNRVPHSANQTRAQASTFSLESHFSFLTKCLILVILFLPIINSGEW